MEPISDNGDKTTLIVGYNVLVRDAKALRRHLESRGVEVRNFDIVEWIREWVAMPAGCFWGRRVAEKGRRYEIYYTACGVTGIFEALPWHPDAAHLVMIAPNEIVPTSVLAGLERVVVPQNLVCRFFVCPEHVQGVTDGYFPVVSCENCYGLGEVSCESCNGTGRYRSQCKPCDGTGRATCRRCDGSGQWKYGGTCNACYGYGYIECRFCGGLGYHDYECRTCGGHGYVKCWDCGGTGVCMVRVDEVSGELTISGKNKDRLPVDPSKVYLRRESDGLNVQIQGSWRRLEKFLKSAIDKQEADSRRAEALTREFNDIIEGLEKKIECCDTTQLPPVCAVLNAASLRRKRKRVFYLLKEKGVSEWKKQHNEPYPPGTTLRIDGVEPPGGAIIIYEGYKAKTRELEVSFPMEMDISALHGRELEIRSAEMRPPEMRQKEYLQRWIANPNSPIFLAMVNGCDKPPARDLQLFNKNIAKYDRQREAVQFGLSDNPLFLLKGPPGTGKTTIIVEIIRQAVHRGQRVLLTSQTHQAVENVLEKLHKLVESGEDKAVRMVHYTAQEGKASELAAQYADGGETAEVKRLQAQVAESLSRLDRRIAELDDPNFWPALRTKCEEGAQGVDQIVTEKSRLLDDLDRLRTVFDAELKLIDDERHAKCARLFDAESAEMRRRQYEMSAKNRALAEVIGAIDELECTKTRLTKRIGALKSDSWEGSAYRFLGWFQSDYEEQSVRESLARVLSEQARAVGDRDRLAVTIGEMQKEIDRRKGEYARERATIDDLAAKAKRDKTEKYESDCRRVGEERELILAKQRTVCRERIADLEAFLGKDPCLTVESSANDWRRIYRELEVELEGAKKKRQYISEWEKTLAETPEAVKKFLDARANVFLATCVGVGGWRSLMDGTYDRRFEDVDGIRPESFFDLVIVDEAGHATCAETIIPLSMGRRAILIGDDKQLPPVDDDVLKTESLFTKLWEDPACRVPRVMLDMQFRMHPDIADFVSDTFYNGELKSGVTKADREFQFSSFNRPVCLLSTSNHKNRYETWKNPSYENNLEAQYVSEVLKTLIEHCNEHGVKDDSVSVAVITPYAEQVSRIRQLVEPFIGASGNVEFSAEDIASVDKFQGGERDVVIASFVRSPRPNTRVPRLTFVQDLKRMNVAFSRARKMLILVGDIKALSSGLGNEDGRRAFEAFHRTVCATGLEVLAWERRESR